MKKNVIKISIKFFSITKSLKILVKTFQGLRSEMEKLIKKT